MRHIGSLPDQNDAQRFNDYLVTLGIEAKIEQENGQWAVWILDEDHVEQAREKLRLLRESPEAAEFQDVQRQAAQLRERALKEALAAKQRYIDVRERWRRPTWGEIPLTLTLILISVMVTVLSDSGRKVDPVIRLLAFTEFDGFRNGTWMLKEGTAPLDPIRNGEVWRLVTPIFIHLGRFYMHLLFNMYWLYILGGLVESRKGGLHFVLLVLALAVTSNYAQFLMSGPRFGGMSGVGYGIFGYVWMKSRFDPQAKMALAPDIVFLFLGWFVFCLIARDRLHVANTAHGVGLAVGMIVGYAPRIWEKLRPSDESP